jgi:MFS family permease
VAPLVWEPVSNRIGRRPTWLIGALIGVVFNIACAKCMTYGAMMVCRLFTAFGIAPALALGPAVVSEMYFVQERPSKVVRMRFFCLRLLMLT